MPSGHPKGVRYPCRHCDMCDDYRLARHADEMAYENGGFRDEDSKSLMITFKKWLETYRYE